MFMSPRLKNNFLKQVSLLIIDRLIVGILAAVIIFLAQQYFQQKKDESQKRTAVAQMESLFITDTLNTVTNNMKLYYQISKKIIDYGQKADKDEMDAMIKCGIAIEYSLGLLETLAGHTIINEEKQNKFKKLVSNISILNQYLDRKPNSDRESKKNNRKKVFDQVKTSYRDTLEALRTAALEAIKQEHFAANK